MEPPLKKKYTSVTPHLDVAKLKTVPVDLIKLSDVVANKVVKNTKFNTQKLIA